MWSHRRQPTKLPCPWDSPGKNTGVGCHVLLQCMKVRSESEVAQLCLTASLYCGTVYYIGPRVLFSHLVVSDSFWPHGLQHARLPCPSPAPRACSNPCLLSWWCYPTISFSVIPFSSCLQCFPVSGLFQWFISLHRVAKVLEFQLQHQPFQWIFRTDFL